MEHGVSLVHLEWFQTRGISEKTLELTGVYSGRHHQSGASWEVIPDIDGKVAVFPYLHHGQEINCKYRAAGKKFYQKTGGTKTFWNVDALDEPCLRDGSVSLVITEGEMDALSVIEAGLPYVVSVPDGAPPPLVGAYEDDIDPEQDTKYGYIFNNWDALKPIRRIIIATDDDEPGKRLAEELVRRLKRVRCQFITYPKGCKDLNEVLLKYGKDAVIRTLVDAKPYAIGGIYKFSELPPEPDLVPLSTGWSRLDAFLRPSFPAFMVITGVAGSGKSSWVNQLVAQMSICHGVGVAIASFEMRIKPCVSEVLLNTYSEMRGSGGSDWLEDNFVFIAPEPGGEPTDNKSIGGYGANRAGNFDIDWLLDKAGDAVIRYGIRILVIDPWNEIEHAMRRMENISEYIGRTIRALKRFAKEFEVLVILVAHPSKSGAQKAKVKSTRKDTYGNLEEIVNNEIELYDISDSAHFANKADFGVVIHRIGESNETHVFIRKVRDQGRTGKLGMTRMTFNSDNKTFSDWQ